ncbi:hypothetical protein [Streptomyces cirratus]|uniref:hypothetical protein n=1 Tax=Streptomyces cirratus TaxID=68187 RepID=UPI0036210939
MGDPVADVGQAVPAELSSFVGRRRELARAASLLATERLVTLTGPAGIGKTRLAVRAVRTVTGADGLDTVWVDVSALPGFRRVVLEHRLIHGLAGREVLLVLDGCEQLGEAAAPLVENLLRWLPRVRVLITSQRRLALPGEAELAVPPLPLPPAPPDPAAPLPIDPIAGFAAVRLYEERARGADPFFELTERNAAAVAALCRSLDGIPGALELAAGRAHQYAPLQALRRLTAEPLAFLAGGAGRATLVDAERSLRLSSPAERLLWERLSVFAGPFDAAAVTEVCGFGELPRTPPPGCSPGWLRPCWPTVSDPAGTGCRSRCACTPPGGSRTAPAATGTPPPCATKSAGAGSPGRPPGCGARGRRHRRVNWRCANSRSCGPR